MLYKQENQTGPSTGIRVEQGSIAGLDGYNVIATFAEKGADKLFIVASQGKKLKFFTAQMGINEEAVSFTAGEPIHLVTGRNHSEWLKLKSVGEVFFTPTVVGVFFQTRYFIIDLERGVVLKSKKFKNKIGAIGFNLTNNLLYVAQRIDGAAEVYEISTTETFAMTSKGTVELPALVDAEVTAGIFIHNSLFTGTNGGNVVQLTFDAAGTTLTDERSDVAQSEAYMAITHFIPLNGYLLACSETGAEVINTNDYSVEFTLEADDLETILLFTTANTNEGEFPLLVLHAKKKSVLVSHGVLSQEEPAEAQTEEEPQSNATEVPGRFIAASVITGENKNLPVVVLHTNAGCSFIQVPRQPMQEAGATQTNEVVNQNAESADSNVHGDAGKRREEVAEVTEGVGH